MRTIRVFTWSCLIALAAIATAYADPSPAATPTPGASRNQAQKLAPVVVTATRIEQPIDQIGTTISVVESDQIQKQQIEQVSNVLEQVPGVVMGLVAAVLFGLGTVLAKRTPLALPPATSVAWQVALGTAVVGLLAVFETADWGRVTPAGWACVTYVATIPMTVAYLAWFRALRLVPASMAATTVLVSPMVGVMGSTLVLGETLGPRQVVALGVTLAGVALAARG